MLKRILVVFAMSVASLAMAIPAADATECKPGRCTGACHITGGSISVDPETGTATIDPPTIECYA